MPLLLSMVPRRVALALIIFNLAHARCHAELVTLFMENSTLPASSEGAQGSGTPRRPVLTRESVASPPYAAIGFVVSKDGTQCTGALLTSWHVITAGDGRHPQYVALVTWQHAFIAVQTRPLADPIIWLLQCRPLRLRLQVLHVWWVATACMQSKTVQACL